MTTTPETPEQTAAKLINEVFGGDLDDRAAIAAHRLSLASLLVGAPTEDKAPIAELVTDPEIGDRVAAILLEVIGRMPGPTPEDRAATPADPGLYLDRLGNTWHRYPDGVFAMSSRIRASAAHYAPFKRLVVAGTAAGVAPQEPSASQLANEAVARLRGMSLTDDEVRERLAQATKLASVNASAKFVGIVGRIAATGRVTSEDLHLMDSSGIDVLVPREPKDAVEKLNRARALLDEVYSVEGGYVLDWMRYENRFPQELADVLGVDDEQ